MPLFKGQPYRLTEQLPLGLKRNHELWVIRTTGEVFLDYEFYLQKVRLYREPVWTCSKTTRSGLTYLQAVMSENAQKTEEDGEEVQKEPVAKPPQCLQMTLTSAVMQSAVDLDLQLIEGLDGVLAMDSGNQTSDGKKKRSSGKEGDQAKSKSDAKKTPGTAKHTFYETLKWVGPNGASISYLHQRLKDCKIQTTWADSSARNCIASLLNHDRAFVKLPRGHYALASYCKEEEPENEKRELSQNENDSPDYPRNNGRCMKCLKAKHPDNSPLVFCDQCPSAIHAVCAEEYETAMKEFTQEEGEGGLKFPYLCYKCVQKRKMAERQKVVRQKREEEKQKRQEERNQRLQDPQDKRKEQDIKKRLFPHKPPVARYPVEDTDLTVEDHRHKEALLNGPLLPEPHPQPDVLLDALSVCEFLSIFGTELDERLASTDLTVAELMYSLCWPFDSSLLKNNYQALLKTAVHQTVKLPDAPSDMRQWNAVLDGYTWPEILKFYLMYQQEFDLVQQIREELEEKEGEEKKLFLEISPQLQMKLLSTLVVYVSSSMMLRHCADARLTEARHLESAITKMKREMNKTKIKTQVSTTANHSVSPDVVEEGGERTLAENGEERKRQLRRRGTPEENKELFVQNELAALEEQLERCKVRCEPLGFDRYRNEYYWLPSLPECLCVINPEQTIIRCVRSKDELDRVMTGLNLRGVREKHLMEALKAEYDNLCVCFSLPEFSFNLDDVARGVSCVELEAFYKANKKQTRSPIDKLKQEYISSALKTMVNRLHKVVGGVATIDAGIQEDIKNIRFKLNSVASMTSMLAFLLDLSAILKRIFQDGTEKQNGKTQMKLTAHLETLEAASSLSLSEMGLHVAMLREIVDPLIRAKSKAQQAAAEAKRKRTDKSVSEKSTSSSDMTCPAKKAKQKHETSEDLTDADVLPFDAVPWRVTRSNAGRRRSTTTLSACLEETSRSETISEMSDSNRLDGTDDDYEVANESEDEQGSSNEEASCRICGFGGRLIECSGPNCDVHVHHGCMYGNKANEASWYCSKCARTKRALFRNDRNK